VCSFEEMDLEESVKMNLDEYEWMIFCVYVKGFKDENEWILG